MPGESDYLWFVLLVFLLGLIGGFILDYLMDESPAQGSATTLFSTVPHNERVPGRELPRFSWLED